MIVSFTGFLPYATIQIRALTVMGLYYTWDFYFVKGLGDIYGLFI